MAGRRIGGKLDSFSKTKAESFLVRGYLDLLVISEVIGVSPGTDTLFEPEDSFAVELSQLIEELEATRYLVVIMTKRKPIG